MKRIMDEIRSEFESKKYTDYEMIGALQDLKEWCEDAISDIKDYM